MNDYYTSQQMQQPPSSQFHPQQHNVVISQSRTDSTKRASSSGNNTYLMPLRHETSFRQSPPSPSLAQAHNQQRQGVIHRANNQRKLNFGMVYGCIVLLYIYS